MIPTIRNRFIHPFLLLAISFAFVVAQKQPGFKGVADTRTSGVVSGRFTVTGPQLELDERVKQ